MTPPYGRKQRIKELLDEKWKRRVKKIGLKLNIQKTKIMGSCPITSWQIDGETMETVTEFILGGSKITRDGDCSHEIKRHLLLGSKAMTNLDSILKSRDIILLTKVHLVKAMFFSSNHVQMWVSDHTEAWVPNNWCFQTVVLEKTLESPLHCNEIKPVSPTRDQSWIFIERTDAEAEAPILWPPDSKSRLIRKDPEAGKDWGQEEKGVTGDEIDGWRSSSTRWIWVWASSRRQWRTGKPGVLRATHGVAKSWTQLGNWTTTI